MMADEPQLLSRAAGQGFEDGLSARALLSSIRRHIGLILALPLSLSAAGAFIGLGLPTWFQAETILVIHARPQRIADVQELPDPLPDLPVILSEADVLHSRSVIEPVVRSLGLWRLPEFQTREYPGGWRWETVEQQVGDLWDSIWGGTTTPETGTREVPLETTSADGADAPMPAQINTTVEKYARYLSVGTDGRSMTIHVSYRAWTPERAATIVNAHIQSYQNLQEQAKVKAAQHANSALTAQVAELRKQLQTAEAAISRYRDEHHLTGAAKDSGALSQQLANLNSQLIAARADLSESQAKAARIGTVVGGKGAADSVPEVIANGTIQLLRGQEAQLVQREADLSKDHGDAYPALRRVRASLQNLREQLNREIGRTHVAALQQVERSRARERTIQQSVMDLTKQVNSADAGLQQLQGNAESIKAVLRDFEKRAEETATDPALVMANSTLISRANPSATSTSRKTPVLAFAGGFVGLILGGLLSVLLELRDRTFRTSAQVEQHVGPVTVGATPRAVRRRRKSPADVILNDNRSVFAEAFRLSWANLQVAVEGPKAASVVGRFPGTAIGITSASSGEGKSTHALAFARTAALAGESVVLVDADLRRSGVSRLLDQDSCFKLKDFLQGQCGADEVIAVEERSGVHFVPSDPVEAAWTSQELQRFFDFVDYLKRQFAIVIIDLPPILGLSETIRLLVAADNIALIIRWGRTDRQFVQFALDALRSAGVVTSAVILNDIDLKAQQRRGYRDRSVIYTDEDLYRAARGKRDPASRAAIPAVASASGANLGSDSRPAQTPDPQRDRSELREVLVETTTIAKSDIQRLYDRYHC